MLVRVRSIGKPFCKKNQLEAAYYYAYIAPTGQQTFLQKESFKVFFSILIFTSMSLVENLKTKSPADPEGSAGLILITSLSHNSDI